MELFKNYYPDQTDFIDSVRKFCKTELCPNIEKWEEESHFPDEVFQKLGAQGFLGILIPEEYGGVGGDYRMAAAWCEAFGEVPSIGLTVAVNMHSLVISHALFKYGSKEAKAKWLPKCTTGEAIGAYAFTEPGAGSDLANIRTKSEKRGDKWIINGAKTFITNGARADYVLVLTRHDPQAGYKGFTTFLVDTNSKGFHVSKKLSKLGWHASDTAELTFDNVEVDETCIMGKVGEGWSQTINNLSWERMMLTLTSLAGARECFKQTLEYCKQRKAFHKRLVDIEIVNSTLSQMYAKIIASEAISQRALDLVCSGKPSRKEAAAAKRFACDNCVWVADRAIQLHGGYGYTTEFKPERWWRDLRLMPIGGGTSEIMANIVAKDLGLLK